MALTKANYPLPKRKKSNNKKIDKEAKAIRFRKQKALLKRSEGFFCCI